MYEQQLSKRARLIGYAIGLVVFVAVVTWKLVVR
jgi:hypothetical protein